MTVSLYSVSAPVFIRMLTALDHVLAKSVEDCERRQVDPATLFVHRLAPDMFPLDRQVQLACDHAKGATARLAGRKGPRFEDTETDFPELSARISRTIDFISSVPAAEIDGHEDRPISLALPGMALEFVADDYLLQFAMPNFYFHVTTAYAIVRNFGVPVGKADYLWHK